MARPERNNVDYFPFICEDGNKMFYIEETYGNDGFATFVKLLRELAKTDYHYLDLSKPSTVMFLSAKCKVSKDILLSIIKDLVDLGKFDDVLWNENKIVWCESFIESIKDAYSKRNNEVMSYQGLLLRLVSLGVRKPSKEQSKGVNNPQSIVKDSIVVDWGRLLEQFNELTGKKSIVVNDKTKKQILDRLKEGYTKQSIVDAITNCYNDEYHIETGHKYLTLEFISRPDKMEKFSTMQDFIKKPKINFREDKI